MAGAFAEPTVLHAAHEPVTELVIDREVRLLLLQVELQERTSQ